MCVENAELGVEDLNGVADWLPLSGGHWHPRQRKESELVMSLFSAAEAEKEFGGQMADTTAAGALSSDHRANGGGASEHDNDNDDDDEALRGYLADLLPWEASNHEVLHVARSGHARGGVRALCLQGTRMGATLHPSLHQLLEVHQVPLGLSLSTNQRAHNSGSRPAKSSANTAADAQAALLACVVSEALGVHRDAGSAQKLGSSGSSSKFVLTPDTVAKIHAVSSRLRCGTPVILMGECGCGKTALLSYMCAWLNLDLEVLDCHGGTSERDIELAFARTEAKALASSSAATTDDSNCGGSGSGISISSSSSGGDGNGDNGNSNNSGGVAFLFLDEMNACKHTGLVEEAITRHSLHGKPLHPGVRVLAAANPYRSRKPGLWDDATGSSGGRGAAAGLVYQGNSNDTAASSSSGSGGGSGSVSLENSGSGAVDSGFDPRADLVYNVHPIPRALHEYVCQYSINIHEPFSSNCFSTLLDFSSLHINSSFDFLPVAGTSLTLELYRLSTSVPTSVQWLPQAFRMQAPKLCGL